MVKISFKKQKGETGLARIGHPFPTIDIKFNKLIVGTIYPPNWQSKDQKWSVAFMVEKEECEPKNNCTWRYITLTSRFGSEEESRKFVSDNAELLTQKYTFHPIDY